VLQAARPRRASKIEELLSVNMGSFISSPSRLSDASMSSILPSPTLPTVHFEHLPTSFRRRRDNPRRNGSLSSFFLGPSSGNSTRHPKKRPHESAQPSETRRSAPLRRALERLRTTWPGNTTHRQRSESTCRPTGTPETYHRTKSSHQYATEGGEGFNSTELDTALQTSQMLGRWLSSSTIEEEESGSFRHAPYTGMKGWGRLSIQVGQRVLNATTRNKTLVSFLQICRTLHPLTVPFFFP